MDTHHLIRVAILAQQAALRIGLREILHNAKEIIVVGETSSLQELEAFASCADVLILVQIASDALHSLRLEGEASPAILLLTAASEKLPTLNQLPVRAWGILPLDTGETELTAAVRAVHEGLIVGDPRLMRSYQAQPTPFQLTKTDPLAEPLTGRELEVLQLVAQGLANKQIAISLGISEHTVKFHISSLTAKLGASNRTEAVRLGTQRGLIVL